MEKKGERSVSFEMDYGDSNFETEAQQKFISKQSAAKITVRKPPSVFQKLTMHFSKDLEKDFLKSYYTIKVESEEFLKNIKEMQKLKKKSSLSYEKEEFAKEEKKKIKGEKMKKIFSFFLLNLVRVKFLLMIGIIVWLCFIPLDFFTPHEIIGDVIYYLNIGLRILPIPFGILLLILLMIPINLLYKFFWIIELFCTFTILTFTVTLSIKAAATNKELDGFPTGTMLFSMFLFLPRPRFHTACLIGLLNFLSYSISHFSFNFDVLFFQKSQWSSHYLQYLEEPIGTCVSTTDSSSNCFNQNQKRFEIPVFIISIGIVQIIGVLITRIEERYSRNFFIFQKESKKRSNDLKKELFTQTKLLENIIPQRFVFSVKNENLRFVKKYDNLTVLEADLVSFTKMCSQMKGKEIVTILNTYFSKFDKLSETYKLEKVCTIGDSFVAIGGLDSYDIKNNTTVTETKLEEVEEEDEEEGEGNNEEENTANKQISNENDERMQFVFRTILMGLDMIKSVKSIKLEREIKIRVGISLGELILGILGVNRLTFDIFGETFENAQIAERESSADDVQVTENVYSLISKFFDIKKNISSTGYQGYIIKSVKYKEIAKHPKLFKILKKSSTSSTFLSMFKKKTEKEIKKNKFLRSQSIRDMRSTSIPGKDDLLFVETAQNIAPEINNQMMKVIAKSSINKFAFTSSSPQISTKSRSIEAFTSSGNLLELENSLNKENKNSSSPTDQITAKSPITNKTNHRELQRSSTILSQFQTSNNQNNNETSNNNLVIIKESKTLKLIKKLIHFGLFFNSFTEYFNYFCSTVKSELNHLFFIFILQFLGYFFVIISTGIISLQDSSTTQFLSVTFIIWYCLLFAQFLLIFVFFCSSLIFRINHSKRIKHLNTKFQKPSRTTNDVKGEKKEEGTETNHQDKIDEAIQSTRQNLSRFVVLIIFFLIVNYVIIIGFSCSIFFSSFLVSNFYTFLGLWCFISITFIQLTPFLLKLVIGILFIFGYFLLSLIFYPSMTTDNFVTFLLNIVMIICGFVYCVITSYLNANSSVSIYKIKGEIEDKLLSLLQEHLKNRNLLLSVLPSSVIKRLSKDLKNNNMIFDHIHNGSCIFIKIIGFEEECLVFHNESNSFSILNLVFSKIDEIIEKSKFSNCYKIKSTGATYIAISATELAKEKTPRDINPISLSTSQSNKTADEDRIEAIEELKDEETQKFQGIEPEDRLVNEIRNTQELAVFAIEIKKEIERIISQSVENHDVKELKSKWGIKIGFSTGSFYGTVLGDVKFLYDVIGDSINVASRCSDAAKLGEIVFSEGIALDFLQHETNTKFSFDIEKRKGVTNLKGKGNVVTYKINEYREKGEDPFSFL